MSDATRNFDVVRVDTRAASRAVDWVAAEAPLEVRIGGQPFSVIMRTPGADRDLTAGFLLTEGVIHSVDDIASIDADSSASRVNVELAPHRAADVPVLLAGRRQVAMNSSCGLCGRRTLESLDVGGSPLAAQWVVSPDVILALPDQLRASQHAFDESGGLHAAGLFD